MLTADRFLQAAAFVRARARPLDRSLFEFYFNNGPASAVLEELAKFQNADGGFGHGIEPDLRLSASSPMATSVGLQYAHILDVSEAAPILQGAIRYLVDTFEPGGDYWTSTFMDVNAEPHAPWWHKESIAAPADQDWANPSAELSGYLHQSTALVPPALLRRTALKATAILEADLELGDFPFYNAMCWERALEGMPQEIAGKIETHLRRVFQSLQPLTAESLREISVYFVVKSPESLLARLYPDVVDQLLDLEIEKQAQDGGWWPTWAWGQYEDAWETARIEWAGKLTVECLHVLHNFAKIEA